ncbi:hypothetical protein [Bacillus halotolerans]|uniref:Uncharacterized protein n=1 Tax=Bacillus halotolerans TaxID=260554 RepID=A0A9Q4ELJ9_9BACI|nr:hypothetical protein [Bacillus halotolerans]MCY9186494.1 hypothetical protein [Bacillus halotolerans]
MPLLDLGIITLAASLINGYEVEKTPEDKLKEAFDYYRNEAAKSHAKSDTNLFLGKAGGIKEGAEILGVDISEWEI